MPPPADQTPVPAPEVVIHTSWRGLVTAAASPVLLLLIGGTAMWSSGRVRAVPLVIALLGLGLGAVAALDYPRRCRFDGSGVTRICALRSHVLAWADIVAIERTAPSTAGRLRQLRAGSSDRPRHASGGLVARGPGRKRWLLTDRIEGAAEYERLRQLVQRIQAADEMTALRAGRPPDDAAPSDLYRRRR
jgi:hypothetical protein